MAKHAKQQEDITLKDALLKQKNALNVIRLVLAALVIFGHAPLQTLGEGDRGFWLNRFTSLGDFSVNMFFVISGFLIMASAQRGSLLSYLWKRFLRIYPGYWVSLLFIMFVATPLALYKHNRLEDWNLGEAFSFFLADITLFGSNYQWHLMGEPSGVPIFVWNGPLWTLKYELLSYLAVALIAFLPGIRKIQKPLVSIGFLASLFVLPLLHHFNIEISEAIALGRLVPCFLAGSLLFFWGDKIPVRTWWVVLSSLISIVCFIVWGGQHLIFVQIFFALSVLGLGAVLPFRWGYKNDLSYGTYIYGWIVQQLLIIFGSAHLGIMANAFLTLVLTLGLAYLSWQLVEKRALKAKNLIGH